MNALLGLLIVCASADVPRPAAESHVDREIAGFQLNDYLGTTYSLDAFGDKKIVVVAFLGTECPLARLYGPRLAELAKDLQPRGVAFVGINSNRHDTLEKIAHYVRKHGIEFPVLKDPGNAVADQFAATRTPEVFVLDEKRVVRYWGRIDDQFGVGYARNDAERHHLTDAIEELLAGREVSTAAVEPVGCMIGRVPRQEPRGDVTYSKQIARVLQKRCVQCHRPGEVAPFALTSYSQAAGWSETIREVINEGRMPPWHASPEYGQFTNDTSMPDSEKQLIDEWIENGLPEGDRSDLPEPPRYVEGWRIPKPDLILSMPESFTVPAKGVVEYQYYSVDPGFTEDKWVIASEVRPGNSSVVHHGVLYIQRPGTTDVAQQAALEGNILAAFAPGTPPLILTDGVARLVPAGSKLVFEMHYTPNGSVQTDRSLAGLVFADRKEIRKTLQSAFALNFRFRIPPHAENHRVEADFKFEEDALLRWLMPHMHYRGKSFRFEAIYLDGTQRTLLDVPRYDFYWQNVYMLAEPELMPKGTVLHCVGHFDNSAGNLVNPDPDRAVTFGLQSWEEMLVGYFAYSPANQDLTLNPPNIEPAGEDEYRVTFQFRPPGEPRAVYLAGNFNEWKPTGHQLDGPDDDGLFTTRIALHKGRYEYKFVIDGQTWRADPSNPEQAGYFRNSVLTVGDQRQ